MTAKTRSMIITARKKSLGQGNVFAPVCHTVDRGSLPLGGCLPPEGSGSRWSASGRGLDRPLPPAEQHGPRSTSGRYASHWDAFLSLVIFRMDIVVS